MRTMRLLAVALGLGAASVLAGLQAAPTRAGNMDPGSGGVWCIHAAPPYYVKAYDPWGYYLVQPVIWYANPWCA